MIRVLIADDHPIVREGLRRIAADQPGITVVAEAADANQALARVGDTAIDVVLLAPVPRPGAIYGIGLNYAAHAAETGGEPPPQPMEKRVRPARTTQVKKRCIPAHYPTHGTVVWVPPIRQHHATLHLRKAWRAGRHLWTRLSSVSDQAVILGEDGIVADADLQVAVEVCSLVPIWITVKRPV